MELLRKKLGEENFAVLSAGRVVNDVGTHTIFSPAMQQVLEQFEQIKKKYDGTLDESRSNIQFPGDLYALDDPANGINEGVLTLTKWDNNASLLKLEMLTVFKLWNGLDVQIQCGQDYGAYSRPVDRDWTGRTPSSCESQQQ